MRIAVDGQKDGVIVSLVQAFQTTPHSFPKIEGKERGVESCADWRLIVPRMLPGARECRCRACADRNGEIDLV